MNTSRSAHVPAAIHVMTPQGLRLALRVREVFPGARIFAAASLRERCAAGERGEAEDIAWVAGFGELMGAVFHSYSCHIFIGAAGIAVRAIAPCLLGKDRDPAVLVLDQRGRYVISLLSGHIGGGNALAGRLAEGIGACPVITTATDVEGLPALDAIAVGRGLGIACLGAVKTVSAALLAGQDEALCDPYNALGMVGSPWEERFPAADASAILEAADGCPGIIVSEYLAPPAAGARVLYLHPRVLCVGVGCRRGAACKDILDAVRTCLARAGLAEASLAGLASIEAKRDEHGLLEAAAALGVALHFFPPERLAVYPVRRPSAKVRELFGIAGVCEPAALAGAEKETGEARLLSGKFVQGGVTTAVAVCACSILSHDLF